MAKRLPPVHPGEVLREDFLKELDLTPRQLAAAIKVPPNRIYQIINCRRAITPDTARRLARYFGTSAEVWLGMQMDYDLAVLEDRRGPQIDREITPRQAAHA